MAFLTRHYGGKIGERQEIKRYRFKNGKITVNIIRHIFYFLLEQKNCKY